MLLLNTTSSGILVLDTMGVIYPVGDDVRDLLRPFVLEHGGGTDTARIATPSRETSLEQRSARARRALRRQGRWHTFRKSGFDEARVDRKADCGEWFR